MNPVLSIPGLLCHVFSAVVTTWQWGSPSAPFFRSPRVCRPRSGRSGSGEVQSGVPTSTSSGWASEASIWGSEPPSPAPEYWVRFLSQRRGRRKRTGPCCCCGRSNVTNSLVLHLKCSESEETEMDWVKTIWLKWEVLLGAAGCEPRGCF